MKTNISLKFKVAKMVISMAAFLPIVGFAGMAQADTTTANSASVAMATNVSTTHSAEVSAFCAAVDSSNTSLDDLISKKEADYTAGKAVMTGALAASRAATDKELYDQRVAANADYAAQFKALAATATTPAETAAVVAFKKTVTQAIATRRANVDVAIKNYRDGVDAILAARDAAYTAALATLGTSDADCSSAQATFQTSIANISDASDQLATLATTRDAKVAAAGTKFSTSVDAAAATLKTALGQ